MPKLLQFDVLTTLSLTILVYSYSFYSCCCVRNVRNPEKFTENSYLWSSRSSKAEQFGGTNKRLADLGVNGKPICDFILVINSSLTLAVSAIPFSRYSRLKIENCWFYGSFPCLTPPSGGSTWDIDVIYTPLKSAFNGLQFRRWHYRSIFIR